MDQVDISFILDSHWYGGLYYLLNTTDTWQQWIEGEAKSYHYTPEVAEKLYKVLGANRYIIHDRRVIDLACNLGYMSLACSNMGARWVLGVEARDIYIKPFNQVLDHWPTKNVSMVQGDIENTDFLETIIKGYDTILYSGHFYYQSTH